MHRAIVVCMGNVCSNFAKSDYHEKCFLKSSGPLHIEAASVSSLIQGKASRRWELRTHTRDNCVNGITSLIFLCTPVEREGI